MLHKPRDFASPKIINRSIRRKEYLNTVVHVQLGFDCLQGWRLYVPSGQPALVFNLPYNIYFPYALMEFPVFQFKSTSSCTFIGHHWKEPDCFLYFPIFLSESSLFQTAQSQLSQPLLYEICFSPLITNMVLCLTHPSISTTSSEEPRTKPKYWAWEPCWTLPSDSCWPIASNCKREWWHSTLVPQPLLQVLYDPVTCQLA